MCVADAVVGGAARDPAAGPDEDLGIGLGHGEHKMRHHTHKPAHEEDRQESQRASGEFDRCSDRGKENHVSQQVKQILVDEDRSENRRKGRVLGVEAQIHHKLRIVCDSERRNEVCDDQQESNNRYA